MAQASLGDVDTQVSMPDVLDVFWSISAQVCH
jgi:hypothetical protein